MTQNESNFRRIHTLFCLVLYRAHFGQIYIIFSLPRAPATLLQDLLALHPKSCVLMRRLRRRRRHGREMQITLASTEANCSSCASKRACPQVLSADHSKGR